AGMIPKEAKESSVLYFQPEATLYETVENEKSNQESGVQSGNVMIQIHQKASQDKYYADLKNKKVVEQKDFMDRLFLIDKTLGAQKWKFTGRQKKILDMACMEAQQVDNTDTITAWYTTAIPVAAGPTSLSGLPGMILEAQVGSSLHIVATKIAPADAASLKLIKAPTKGKKVTEAAYLQMVKEKTEEMQKQFGGNGNNVIMIQGNH
ncbi:MAG: GLPGLI family protein, partial [Sphingobacteriales bacterium]